MDMALIAGNQVLVMFILIGVGIFCDKRGLISTTGSGDINKLIVMVVSPSVIITSYNRPYDQLISRNLLISLALAAISHIIVIILAHIFIRGKTDYNKMERFSIIFSNSGFMGIPLISALIGPDGIIFVSAYIVVFALVQWSVGVLVLQGKTDIKRLIKNLILNPGVISVVIGLALFFLPISLPSPIATAVEFVSYLNTPLAMIVVGTFVSRTNPIKALTNPKTYLISFLRLITAPLLMLPIYILLKHLPTDMLLANFIATACPVAVLSVMFPAMYKMDGKYPSNFVTVSTLLSVATIPLMVILFSSVIG